MFTHERGAGGSDATAIFSAKAIVQDFQTSEVVYLGGNVNHNAELLSIEVDRRIRNVCCSFQKHTLKLCVRPSDPLELKI